MSGQGAIARSEIQADRNKIKARRNKIQAGGNKIQIRRNKIQMPVPSANRGFSIGYRHSRALWTICATGPFGFLRPSDVQSVSE
jgi:predicted transcriptional regulator